MKTHSASRFTETKASRPGPESKRKRTLTHQLNGLVLALALVAAAALPSHAAGDAPAPSLLVKWRDGPESTTAAAGNAAIGSTVVRNFPFLGWQWVELPEGLSLADGMARYRQLDSVLMIEPNRKVPVTRSPVDVVRHDHPLRPAGEEPPVIPNDPRFPQQWSLRKIGATNAWATTTGSPEVVVAVIDTGVNYHHQDLKDNMWRNPGETGTDSLGRDKATNGVDDDDNGYVDDVYGIDPASRDSDPMDQGRTPFHGTMCASIIGASGNDGRGITGLNWRVSLMAIRVMADDQTYESSLSSITEAYEYLLLMKDRGVNIRVASMSYGYGTSALRVSRDAHEALGNAGILQVNGAYNDGSNLDARPAFPASWRLPSMVIVGGSTQSDAFWSSSNYGPSSVDLAAPATGILMASGPSATDYVTGDGTSFAGPHVAGAAALLLAAQPDLSIDQLKAALFGSVDQSAAFRGKVTTHGRLNVGRALEYLTEPNPPAIVIGATPRGLATLPNEPIRAVFNRPMDHRSVEEAWEIQPFVGGTFQWADDDRSFTFQPEHPFDRTADYTVRLRHTAADQSGGTLDGNFSRVRELNSTDDFVWKFGFPPLNDEFDGAIELAGGEGSVAGNNRRAWADEVGELAIFPLDWDWYNTVWYRWTPPGNGGWYTFDLTGSTTFDSFLIICRGDRLEQLVTVATNDNHGTLRASRASFTALAGTHYSIVVASNGGFESSDTGNFQIRWYPTPPPGFTGAPFAPSSATPGALVRLNGTNFTGATAVLFNGASASFTNALTNNLDLRITADVPPDATSGPITIVTPHGNVTSTAVFEVLPPPLSIQSTASNQWEIRWPATSPALVLESVDSLTEASWAPVPETPIRADGITRVTITPSNEPRFYRLRSN